jgi:hypothetical protein
MWTVSALFSPSKLDALTGPFRPLESILLQCRTALPACQCQLVVPTR